MNAIPVVIPRSLRISIALVLLACFALSKPAAAGQDAATDSAGAGTNAVPQKAPDWLRHVVLYEIFPRNFSQAGNFAGITVRLDDLQDLGINAIWLMPIHPLGERMKKGALGSPYCVRDFYAINPDYGTTNDFKQLIDQAHQRGIKIIMDVVAGHTSWDSVMMAHPEFYAKDASGKMHPPYPEWTDVAELDYSNPDLRRYMIDMMKYWVQDFSVDGFRCDTAFTVPVDFWAAAAGELDKINPQNVIITDSGAKPLLLSKAFDMDYGGNLFETLNDVMSGEQPASLLVDSWQHTREQFPSDALHLHFTDHHNMPRATARFGLAGALAAQTLMLTLDGVPLFYNGMEVGDATESADPALFEKMPVFWQPGGRPPLRAIYRDLIKLRKSHEAFTNNDVTWVTNNAPDSIVSFIRRDAKVEYLVLINLSNRRVTATVDVPGGVGDFEPVKISGRADPIDIVLPDFHLNGYGWFIYHRAVSK